MGPGPFWIENRNLETIKKINIFYDYWFPQKNIWVGGLVGGQGELVIWMFAIFLTLQHP